MRRQRGSLLGDSVFALGLVTVLLGVHAQEIMRQRQALAVTTGETRARTALISAYERVRTGAEAPPAPGETRELRAPKGCTLVMRRVSEPTDPRLARDDLVPVVLRVTWRDVQGEERSRELTTLVRRSP